MATTKSNPSVILSDAIATLSKTVNSAFAVAENEARVEASRVATEAREVRRERDEALRALHDMQLEEQTWKQEVAIWKAAAEKGEMTIKHQTDAIAQFKQESRQWKDQCSRLEETSRREALDWKEQFLRVEQDRRVLAARVDELVAEKLAYSSQNILSQPFFTPTSRYPPITEPSTSSVTTKRASTSSNPFQSNSQQKYAVSTSASDPESPSEMQQQQGTRLSQKSKPSKLRREAELDQTHASSISSAQRAQKAPASATSAQRAAQRPTSVIYSARQEIRSEPRQHSQVIRHVTATIDVPVKQEEMEEDETYDQPSASASLQASSSAEMSPTVEAAHIRKANHNQSRRQQKKPAPPVNEDDTGSSGEEYAEDDAHESSSLEDDDDELMMGAEANRKELYGTRRFTPRTNASSSATRSGGSSSKKRKQVTGRLSGGGSATKTRRL